MKKVNPRIKRKERIRGGLLGTRGRLRLNVFRSNKHIYAQVIDDEKGITLASLSDLDLSAKEGKGKKVDVAGLVGKKLGEKMKKLKIEKVIFDRAGYKYHGRIKAVAEGIRGVGIKV